MWAVEAKCEATAAALLVVPFVLEFVLIKDVVEFVVEIVIAEIGTAFGRKERIGEKAQEKIDAQSRQIRDKSDEHHIGVEHPTLVGEPHVHEHCASGAMEPL